jgi:hypothetical protein
MFRDTAVLVRPSIWALLEILRVQIKLSQVKECYTAETETAPEAARFDFQLLNAPVHDFSQAIADLVSQIGDQP